MTGFGNAEVSLEGKRIQVSVKSVNGKSADMNIRLPQAFKEIENGIRSLVLEKLKRGKIDVVVTAEHSEEDSALNINKGVILKYMEEMREVTRDMDDLEDDDLLAIVSRFPNVVSAASSAMGEDEGRAVLSAAEEALNKLCAFRENEGEKLAADLLLRIDTIATLRKEIGELEGERSELVRERLKKQIEQLSSTVEVNRERFEQELIYYLERLDITEELVRLESHLQLFRETMNEEESQGKKLSFISQEVGREINTIGSKANHFEIQKKVVMMKDELEKIKEQLFNIL